MVVGVGGGGGTCEWGEGEGQSGDETLLCLDTPAFSPRGHFTCPGKSSLIQGKALHMAPLPHPGAVSPDASHPCR